MLTITGIVYYSTTSRLTRVKLTPKPVERKVKTLSVPSKPKKTSAERVRERREKARAKGLCGICAARWPRPGYKSCDVCLAVPRKHR